VSKVYFIFFFYILDHKLFNQMGTTGSSASGSMNAALPSIISRGRQYATVPLAVGFGVATREHFNFVVRAGADAVVLGSRIVSVIKESPKDEIFQRVERCCREICGDDAQGRIHLQPVAASPSTHVEDRPTTNLNHLPMRFGQFGGQYVPEVLFDCLLELEEAHKAAVADPEFWEEYRSQYGFMNRPSKLYYAEGLTKEGGGAGIWLKREDL
jgi:tryptophan synthase